MNIATKKTRIIKAILVYRQIYIKYGPSGCSLDNAPKPRYNPDVIFLTNKPFVRVMNSGNVIEHNY